MRGSVGFLKSLYVEELSGITGLPRNCSVSTCYAIQCSLLKLRGRIVKYEDSVIRLTLFSTNIYSLT